MSDHIKLHQYTDQHTAYCLVVPLLLLFLKRLVNKL